MHSATTSGQSQDVLQRCGCLLPISVTEAELPSALAGLLAQLRRCNRRCEDIADELASAWQIPQPWRKALVLVAQQADRSGLTNSYHNPAHTRDVVVNWANLAALNQRLAADGRSPIVLDPTDLALGICAALGHDLLHDGIGNVIDQPAKGAEEAALRRHVPFRLEQPAADHTLAVLRSCAIGPELADAVAAAILCTEPVHGLAMLDRDGPLARPAAGMVALMLRDADVLASVGLTAAEHDRQSALLSIEFGTDLKTQDAAETLFAQTAEQRLRSPAGALFVAQFQALRALNRLRGSPGGWLSLEAAGRRLAGS